MAYKVFTNGSTLQASELNENLMQQSVATFSNAAARTAAITSPVEGQTTYLIDEDRYDSWSGSAWLPLVSPAAWTSFTPTLSGITLGNGTIDAAYAQIGKTIVGRILLTLGSTSSVTGPTVFGIPFNAKTIVSILSNAYLIDAGTAIYAGITRGQTGTIRVDASAAGGTYVSATGVSSTIPHTWTTSDSFQLHFTYERN